MLGVSADVAAGVASDPASHTESRSKGVPGAEWGVPGIPLRGVAVPEGVDGWKGVWRGVCGKAPNGVEGAYPVWGADAEDEEPDCDDDTSAMSDLGMDTMRSLVWSSIWRTASDAALTVPMYPL